MVYAPDFPGWAQVFPESPSRGSRETERIKALRGVLSPVSEVTRKLVRLAGIEPTTLGFGGQYSIH